MGVRLKEWLTVVGGFELAIYGGLGSKGAQTGTGDARGTGHMPLQRTPALGGHWRHRLRYINYFLMTSG